MCIVHLYFLIMSSWQIRIRLVSCFLMSDFCCHYVLFPICLIFQDSINLYTCLPHLFATYGSMLDRRPAESHVTSQRAFYRRCFVNMPTQWTRFRDTCVPWVIGTYSMIDRKWCRESLTRWWHTDISRSPKFEVEAPFLLNLFFHEFEFRAPKRESDGGRNFARFQL